MQLQKILKSLGLKDKEPEIFATLLRLPGFHPASTIATKSGINRTTTYKALTKLTKMGLISKTNRQDIFYFAIENPEQILQKAVIQEVSKAESLQKDLVSLLPFITNLKKEHSFIPRLKYYEGIEGIRKIYEDTLTSTEPIYAFTNIEQIPPEQLNWLNQTYVPKRV